MCFFYGKSFVLLLTLIPSSPTPLKFSCWLIRRFNINLQSVVKAADISRMVGGVENDTKLTHMMDKVEREKLALC